MTVCEISRARRVAQDRPEREGLFEEYYGAKADGTYPGCGAPNPKRPAA